MSRILATVGALVVCLSLVPPATADMWDQLGKIEPNEQAVREPSGFLYRGGVNFTPPPGGGGTIVDLGGDLSKGCSAFNFASSFKALFDANALEKYTVGLATTALASAPLTLLCYASPTLCDAYKHLKALTQAQLAANQAACQRIETAAEGLGRAMRATAVRACLDEKAAAGVAMHEAIDTCAKLDPGQTILTLKGAAIGSGTYNLVERALETAGASAGMIALAKDVTGVVSFSTTGPGGTATVTPPPPGAVMAKYEKYFTESHDKVEQLVKAAARGQQPTTQQLQQLGGFGIVVTPRLIAAISQLPPGRRDLAVDKIAAALARIRLETQLSELQSQLQSLAGSERGGHRETLQHLATQIEDQLRQVRAIEAAQQAIAAPADAILLEGEHEVARGRRVAAPEFEPHFPAPAFGGVGRTRGP